MRKLLNYTAVCIFLLIADSAKTQGILTLQQAIDLALKNNFDVQLARNNVQINSTLNTLGVAGGLPSVNGSISDNQSVTTVNQKLNNGTEIQRNNAGSNAFNANVSASYLLYNGLRVVSTKKRLEELEKQSRNDLNAQLQNTIAAVMVKYYDIIRQEGYMKTISQSMEVTRKRQEIIKARKDIGLANNADIFQMQIDLNANEQELFTQEIILKQSMADLSILLNLPADTTLLIKDTIIADTTLKLETIMSFIANNPEVLAAAQDIKISEFNEREVAAQRYPAVRLNGGYNYIRNKNAAGFTLLNINHGPFIGVNAQIPIFNGGAVKRQQTVASINTQNATINHDRLVSNLSASVVKQWQSYSSNLARLKKEQENNQLAASLLQLTMQRYQLNQATIIDLREAQRSFTDAGFRLVNIAYATKMAEIELNRLGSRLGL